MRILSRALHKLERFKVRRVSRFLGMTNSTAIINGAFVNFKSSFCGMFPLEQLGAFQTFYAKFLAKVEILNQLCHSRCNGLCVEWIDQQTSVADHLRETGLISYQDRRSTFHRFEWRQTEAFEIGRINKEERSRVKSRQINFGDVPRQNN